MRIYKVLSNQVYSSGNYSLVPIRFEESYDIMQWCNDQIYHLRQAQPLTKEDQDVYLYKTVAKLIDHG